MSTAPVTFPQSPSFNGLSSSTSTNTNPALERKLKDDIETEFRHQNPNVNRVSIELVSSTDGAAATSDRNVYNHFGFVEFKANGFTCSGSQVQFKGSIHVDNASIMTS